MAAVGTVPGHLDLGGTVWERKLIKAFRRRNFLWRSEQCYPGWIKRMVRFIEPMAPETIDGEGIGRFLSEIALRGRVSPATQKQALNAIVFFMREGLGREPGEIDFRRARPKVRMPVVLTSGECSRLFGEMEGTGRYQRSVFGYLRDSPTSIPTLESNGPGSGFSRPARSAPIRSAD